MEIIKINLENEMDLMLAYKRSMKLAELCGLSVITQTSFATAVSEIARCAIKDKKGKPALTLKIDLLKNNKKNVVASINAKADFEKDHPDALRYARRLSDGISIVKNASQTEISFVQSIGFSRLLSDAKLESFAGYFRNEPPISPYDEVRKKNIMLLEVSEKLRNSENKYKELTKTLPLMIFTTNAMGNLTYGNKWLMDYFKLADIVADNLHWTSLLHPLSISRIKQEWENCFIDQDDFTAQAQVRAREGEDALWHLISLTPVKNEDGKLISWTGFFVDIHSQKLVEETLKNNQELKKAQTQLLKYQKSLEEKVFELNKSNHDLEQFAYIASHDLQEPLRKIRTFAALVNKDVKDSDAVEKYISKIDASAARMASLIKEVLNYSRLIKTDNVFVEMDIHEVINNVVQDMELLIEEKKAKVKVDGISRINAVPRQMQQLFYNLVSNALKFNEGTPEINISSRPLTPADVKKIPSLHPGLSYIEILVKDNGIGFEKQYAEQIFTIFKRLHRREVFAGTGIGLALCKKIVDNHHGIIDASSEPGKGTTFRVVVPQD